MTNHLSKEWFKRNAELEGDSEIGAGFPPLQNGRSENQAIRHDFRRLALGSFVALWRRNRGWNVERLATEAQIDPEELLEIERDQTVTPEPDAVYKLAEVLHVPPTKLLELAGLTESSTPNLREGAIRFAARSETISKLSNSEKEALEAFVATLNNG